MRTEWCREHIDEVGENCGLSTSAITEVKKASEFVSLHVEFSNQPTATLRPLIRERNEEIKARAISSISKSLESGKHPITGKHLKKGRLTEADVKKVIEQKDRELRLEAMAELRDNPQKETPLPTQPQEETVTPEPEPEPTQEPAQKETVQETIAEPILEKKRISNDDKIKYLTDHILKPEHLKTLKAIVQAGEADDILDALYVILDNLRED